MNSNIIPCCCLTLVILLSFCSGSTKQNEKVFLRVTKITDGDTFRVDDGSEKGLRIRLIGVDTPETRHPQKPVEYFGKEATEFLTKMIANRLVRLEYDVQKQDRFGRTLAYVYLKDGAFVNAELVKQGYARVYTVPPNVKYAELFVELQREAREHNRGLWAGR